jgi:L-iditol 2-dehydrogenase
MRAAIYHGPGDVRIERRPIPEPGAGEVLISVDAALTDGTDAKCYRRGHPVLLGPPPSPFGHEYAGTVVAVGEGSPYRPGVRVAGANSAPCGSCPPCRRDDESLCENLLPLLNGAYAEYLLVPERIARVNLHPIPDDLAAEVAAMCEPLACAIHGAEATGAGRGDAICVLGRGALGRMLATALEARGCAVTTLGSADDDPPAAFDAVIEAAGTADAWQRGVRLVRPGGTVVLFGGLPGGTAVPFDAYRLHYEAITVRGVFHHAPRHIRAALDLLASGAAAFRPLLTHTFGLDDVVVPLEMTCGIRPREGLVKAVIRAG